MKLLKQYWKNGVFFTALSEFLLLGRSRTALEILRLSTSLKSKQKLEKKYREKLSAFDQKWKEQDSDNLLKHTSSKKVWICWFQGLDQAPALVQRCYQSIKENIEGHDIILITADNMMDYVQFPDYIMNKWKQGKITHTHMTDLLRLELLIKYGGLWVDATVLCISKDIPNYFFDSDLFFYQCLKPGRDGHSGYISSWLMSAKTNNKLLIAARELLYEYWKENDYIANYFLLHDFISIILEFYPDEWKKIVPRDNSTPHILLLRLFEHYDEDMWKAIKEQTPFHKLTYKFRDEDANMENTYYQHIVRGRYKPKV